MSRSGSSISEYDIRERVASYDVDMDLMHPLRRKMVDIALEILPHKKDHKFKALDLGSGTGYFTQRFLSTFPGSKVIAIDGAEAMVAMAKERLGELSGSVEFKTGDFRLIEKMVTGENTFDILFSSYALHHLNRKEKGKIFKYAHALLKEGGWFLNADLVNSGHPEFNERYQDLRIKGIVERAEGKVDRFKDYETTASFLRGLETTEADQPLTLLEDLSLLKGSGFLKCDVFWAEYREVVTGGIK